MTQQDAPFRIEKKDHVAWLVLDRPDKRNAMDQAFFGQLGRAFDELATDDEVRVVVIRGEGKAFTAGLDLKDAASLFQGTGADDRARLLATIRQVQASFTAVERCPKPVIAAAHGPCIGAGVDLLSACDIRMASQDAVFSVRETRIAIIADLGTLQRLHHIVGQGWARELVLTGRDFSAQEARDMGFITHLCDDPEELVQKAGELAEAIAANPPLAVQGSKDVLNFSRDHDVASGLEYVAQKNAAMLYSQDLMEAMQAFMEKRPPRFKGK